MPIDSTLRAELAAIRTIDMTTFGRTSGLPRRVEIWWFHTEDRFIVTGTPGPRHWLANLRADPRLIVHANGATFEAQAVEITDQAFRERFFRTADPEISWYSTQAELDVLVTQAPMIEVLFP
ncbi:MAG: nitroreductase family deazaflavin-dependent oxidoreductase [Acidimicrobiia bacterium]|nr:nitroreductase family deazaflavin-dependent oxidoreductase [Acidimicrobiia bacterium]MDH4305981.1 nitroreductase family deazaflavin-dependent oxidoreductase [Acidimicrobiia bacterium]